VGVAAPGVTVGGVGGGSILNGIIWYEKGQQYKWPFLLTYCNQFGTNHSAWKMRRQSYNSDGITEGTLWLGDGHSMVSCTGISACIIPVSSIKVG